jgi:hypothetical protein
MGISATYLPDASPYIPVAFAVALEITNEAIALASSLMYKIAVYNLGGSNLINYAQDVTNPPAYYPPNTDSKVGFFAYTRGQYNSTGFVAGVIQASADEGTSESLLVPDAMKNLTLMNLQQLKDPYGRRYLEIAQDYGPAVWGLS